jgi:hypothetical protein
MAGFLIDAGATIMCPHGGQVKVVPTATRVTLTGMPPLTVSDTAMVSGCPFNVSGAPSPCLTVQWLAPATRVSAQGAAPLLSSSIGLCKNAAGAPQGTAIVTGFQTRVQG